MISQNRRQLLKSAAGMAALNLPSLLEMQAQASVPNRSARSCIVVFCWGGMSQYESFDPRPGAISEYRGEFSAIDTSVPGIRFCEHLPGLAKHADKMAVIRSVHHDQGGHQQGLYISLTGHRMTGGRAGDRENWPSLTAMISRFADPFEGAPAAIRLPYSMYDNGTLMAGEYGGWLGGEYDPILMKTPAGRPFAGVSRYTTRELDLKLNLKPDRVQQRRDLLRDFDQQLSTQEDFSRHDRFRRMAADMLMGPGVREAYDLESEDLRIRTMYGNHIGGQSMLLARRLVESGVPVVQVCAGAGDLAGGGGDNWDTHRNHFPKMKDRLLPVFDRSASALLTDLEQRGMLEETLVVFLTDFGRTPRVNNNGGRDHYPAVYSAVLAGGGIKGGQVYGSSNPNGTAVATGLCSPGDVHATVYRALGIDAHAELTDSFGRPFQICDGQPLPLV